MKKLKLSILLFLVFLGVTGGLVKAKEGKYINPPFVQLIGIDTEAAEGVTVQAQTSKDIIIFRFDLKTWGKGMIRLSDARGKILLEKEIKDWDVRINLQDALPGFYSITLEKGHLLEIVEIRKE